MTAVLTLEDFEPGGVTNLGTARVEREEMLGFARRFDAQPFHLDEAAAQRSGTGRLIASGWYGCAVQMRLLTDAWLHRAVCLGSPGVDKVEWRFPVHPGDVLACRQTVVETRPLASRPGKGLMRFHLDLSNQDGAVVMHTDHLVLLGTRGGAPSAGTAPPPREGAEPAPLAPLEDPQAAPRHYEEVEIGRTVDLGTVRFTAEDIVAFATRFDPQSFHLGERGGRAGPFGALAASGWHTAAAWMSRHVARLDRLAAAGGRPKIGVSPGFQELKWLRPVYAGDVIRFGSQTIAKRPLASRPGWGLVSSRNTGWNAAGECVLSFTGNAFWAMAATEPVLSSKP